MKSFFLKYLPLISALVIGGLAATVAISLIVYTADGLVHYPKYAAIAYALLLAGTLTYTFTSYIVGCEIRRDAGAAVGDQVTPHSMIFKFSGVTLVALAIVFSVFATIMPLADFGSSAAFAFFLHSMVTCAGGILDTRNSIKNSVKKA